MVLMFSLDNVLQEGKRRQFQELAQLMRDLLDRRRQIMSKTLPRVSFLLIHIYAYSMFGRTELSGEISYKMASNLKQGALVDNLRTIASLVLSDVFCALICCFHNCE